MTESSINTSVATAPPVPASVPKVSYPPSLPISRKAYRRFIDRIHQVYSAELPVARLMVSVLDVYLLGDRNLAGAMLEGSDHKHAFSFLCQDVDMAIERSRRARQQALARRLARQQAEAITPSTSAPSVPSASSDNNDNISEELHSDLTKAESAILSGQEIGGHEVWSGRRVNDMSRIPMFSSLLNPVVNTIARSRAERRAQEQTLKRKLKSRNRPLT